MPRGSVAPLVAPHLGIADRERECGPCGTSRFRALLRPLVPQGERGYEHDDEGPDDLPAHFKASLLGCQLSLPVNAGRLQLGTWQGVYLGEHRAHGGVRQVVATLHGEGF